MMNEKRLMLRHCIATIAYRTQKALKGAPPEFTMFQAAPGVRTPHELIWHMTEVLGYSRTFLIGGAWEPRMEEDFGAEVKRLDAMLSNLNELLGGDTPLRDMTPERLLQGPFADAMTHVGQLAMLRRFFGSPVSPENFIMAEIDPESMAG